MAIVRHAMRGFKPVVTATLHLDTGADISITDDILMQGSLCSKKGTSLSGQFTVGGAVISSISFSILDYEQNFHSLYWTNSRINFTFTYPDGTSVTTGTFFVVSHKESGVRVYVECYDVLKLFDEYSIYEDGFDFTNGETVNSCLSKIASRYNNMQSPISLSFTGYNYGSWTVPDPGDDTMTERAFLSYLAQIMGQYIYADGFTVHFAWYNHSTVFDEGVTFSHDLRTSNFTIGGVKVLAKDDKTLKQLGGGYMIEIANNPLITADNLNTIATAIYNAVRDITYRAGSVSIVNDGLLKAGDYIQVETGQESGIEMLATNITFYPTKLRMTVTADADNTETDLRITRSRYIKKAAQDAVAEELADPDSDLSQAIEGAAGGDGCEWVKLPLSKIYMKASSSMVNSFETFHGFTLELDKQDNYHSNITQLIARNPSNSEQDQDGIDVYKVFYPDQYVRVPAINETGRWIELWVGEIIQPSLNDYRDVYGHSFTEARRQARLCKFCSTNTQPARVRIYVKRFKGENYDYLSFGTEPSDTGDFSTTDPIRPRVLYNGLQLLDQMPGAISPPNPRIPYVRFYFPGQCYDLLEANTTTYHKWCYRHGQTETGELELIPAYYFYS